jgi:hypothetical protein
LYDISTKIVPRWVQSVNQADFLRSRPFLQLRFASDRIADYTIVFVIDQFLALILGSKTSLNSLAVLPGAARKAVTPM